MTFSSEPIFIIQNAPRKERRWEAITLIVILLVGSILGLKELGAESFWHDEALTTTSARVTFGHAIQTVRNSENCPPGYFLVINLWSKLFPETATWLRLPSALLGIASIAVIYLLGRELFETRTGLTASALLALSPFHIAYSQEARPYALLLFLLLICTWSFVRMMRTGSASSQVMYVIAAVASLYTQTFAIFTVAAINLYFGLMILIKQPTGTSLRRWLTLQAAVIVLFGGWIPATIEVAHMGLPWMIHPTRFHEAMAAYAGGWIALGVLTIVCLIAIWRGWRIKDPRVWLIALIAIVPVLGPCLYGVFTPRYGIGAMIGLMLLAAYGTAQFGGSGQIAIVMLAAVNWFATSTLGHARYPGYTPKPDTRSADRYVIENGHPGDVLINRSDQLNNRAIEYYLTGSSIRRMDNPPIPLPQRLWAITRNGGDAGDLPYNVISRHQFDGIDLLELRRKSSKTAATSEPVAPSPRSD